MKRPVAFLASCAFLTLGAGAASASCAEELAEYIGETGSVAEAMPATARDEGIAKDGTLAPLQDEEEAAEAADEEVATVETSGEPRPEAEAREGIAKDGSIAPLEEEAGDGDDAAAGAVSGQDAQARQLAAASDEREQALIQARLALEEGDEEACMEALEEARSL